MEAKQVKIGIKTVEEGLADFANVLKAIEHGKTVQAEPPAVYFVDRETFKRALTKKRLELLHVVREERPQSLRQLARLLHRDVKNVTSDVNYLAGIGLIELKQKDRNSLLPVVRYERISLDIAV